MTIEEIIKANEDALDVGDFTTLMPSIPFEDEGGWQNLCEVLHMLHHVGIEPFCNYHKIRLNTVIRCCKDVFRPTNKDIGVLQHQSLWRAIDDSCDPLFNALGVSVLYGYFISSIDGARESVRLMYKTEDGLGDKLQYWENVLGRKWEESDH